MAPVGTSDRPRSRILTLPALLVNQIAAGEVVERPASVVKELLDNAIDSGASRISIELEQGGVELVRISDDGAGIEAEDLPLAVAPHATSKIKDAADLQAISTMGFRGEALASIASVSRMSIRSRARGSVSAHIIEASGDVISPARPDSGPVGTAVSVRNLFFNTPVRRKFLRTPATEQGHCLDIVRALAMSHPRLGFTLTADGRTLLDLPADQSPRERIVAILGEELSDKLLVVEADEFIDGRGVSLWGVVGMPEIARPTAKAQRLFVNGRPVRDQTVLHALQEAYRGLIDPSRRPTAALMLEMTPDSVDVNVHPSKAEVRFRDSGLIHSIVLRAVREALRNADLTPRWGAGASAGAPGARDAAPAAFDRVADRPVEFGTGIVAMPPSVSPEGFADAFRRLAPAGAGGFDYDALRRAVEAERAVAQAASVATSQTNQAPSRYIPVPEPISASPSPMPEPRRAERVLQVHNSYLVTQDEHGVVIIDQHALHERVMFEQIMQRLETSGSLESQRLLTPAVVNTTAQRVERLADLKDVLTRLGVEAEPMGPAAVAVHAFPTFLFDKRVEPAEFLSELLEKADADGLAADKEAAIHDVVDMMACKAAVKAGDRLTGEELGELMAMRERVERASNCPHGRPTTIRLTIRDLEKRFGRG